MKRKMPIEVSIILENTALILPLNIISIANTRNAIQAVIKQRMDMIKYMAD